MLSNYTCYPLLHFANCDRSCAYYEKTLGLPQAREMLGSLFFGSGNSGFFVTERHEDLSAHIPKLIWVVDDIEAEMTELRSRGLVFEEYDLPGLRTVNGIATTQHQRTAWFKDNEGNLLAIAEPLLGERLWSSRTNPEVSITA